MADARANDFDVSRIMERDVGSQLLELMQDRLNPNELQVSAPGCTRYPR